MARHHTLLAECVGEFVGTCLLIFLGLATGAASVTTGAQVGLWQVAVVWGFSVALSIYLVNHISGAHLNPAVTLSLAASRHTRFPLFKVIPYILAQLLGAMVSGLLVLAMYGSALRRYEQIHSITRGDANSTLSAMVFGEYFPNPQIVKSGALARDDVSHTGALFAEAMGTMVLMLMVRGLTDPANTKRPSEKQAPFFIGFTIAVVISIVAPITQAGFNPVRDFGPRVVAYCAGWDSVAIPGPRNGFWVYILGPILGALAGGMLYDFVVYPAYIATSPRLHEKPNDDEVFEDVTAQLIHTIGGPHHEDADQSAGTQGSRVCRTVPRTERAYHALNEA